jgi:AcrR family transcriptional regulator
MDTKQRIIEKAADLFFQFGIKNVSMDELASTLGISKRTIYENFKDKEDILMSFILKLRGERDADFQPLLAKDYNVMEVFIKIIELQQTTPVCDARFFQDIYKYYPQISRMMHENEEKSNAFLRGFLQKGIKQGYIREDLNVNVVAFLVEEATNIYVRASYLEKPPFSFADLFYTMMINFVRGISTEKGIKIIDDYLAKRKQEKINQYNYA